MWVVSTSLLLLLLWNNGQLFHPIVSVCFVKSQAKCCFWRFDRQLRCFSREFDHCRIYAFFVLIFWAKMCACAKVYAFCMSVNGLTNWSTLQSWQQRSIYILENISYKHLKKLKGYHKKSILTAQFWKQLAIKIFHEHSDIWTILLMGWPTEAHCDVDNRDKYTPIRLWHIRENFLKPLPECKKDIISVLKTTGLKIFHI